jgi:hypothetical protein
MARFCVVVSLALILQIHVAQAQIASSSDPEALQLAVQATAALSKGVQVADITLKATVTSIAGTDSSAGTATLLAKGTGESRIDLSLDGSTRSEVRSSPDGNPQGTWTDKEGKAKAISLHNCFTDAAWFFPALSSLTQSSNRKVIFSLPWRRTARRAVRSAFEN